jgi:hypothetical protein
MQDIYNNIFLKRNMFLRYIVLKLFRFYTLCYFALEICFVLLHYYCYCYCYYYYYLLFIIIIIIIIIIVIGWFAFPSVRVRVINL